MEHPGSRVVLITGCPGPARHVTDRTTLVNALVPESAGLGEIVRRTLALCSLGSAAERAEQSLSPYVFTAMEYLRFRYSEEVTGEDIARAAGVSRGHLAERFRAELGLSLSQYLMSLRVEVAKSLLRGRTAKLDEVATLAGFYDPSHLSRVFRAHTGRRPGAYQRQFSGL
jgi:transcriptional regulator GlxA family with amidase domain